MSKTPPPYPKSHDLLAGKTVLITAAAGGGIGLATAKRCAEEGATVMISDIHEKRLTAAAEQISEITGKPTAHRLCNVREDSEVRALAKSAIDEMGCIDILVNNAGLGGTTNVVDMTDDQWNAVIDITLTGCFRMTRAVLPHMMERKAGVIVNNASILGWRAQEGQAHYAAAKAGVMALTRCSAIEAADAGVRINAVSPSLALHEFLVKVMDQETLDHLVGLEAFGRGAETWEIANVIVFLASEYSSYMTGEIVSVSSQRA